MIAFAHPAGLAEPAGLQAGTVRAYINEELARLTGHGEEDQRKPRASC